MKWLSKWFKNKWFILFFVTFTIIGFDQWTKALVIATFYLGESVPVVLGYFHLTYIRNPGAAFGMLAGAHPAFRVPFFIAVPIIALGVIGYVFKKIPSHHLSMAWALSLVIGGAVGNLIDRIRFGYVIDFLDFFWRQYHFPAFNVADSAICVGVGLLMLDVILQERRAKNVSTAV